MTEEGTGQYSNAPYGDGIYTYSTEYATADDGDMKPLSFFFSQSDDDRAERSSQSQLRKVKSDQFPRA